MKLCISYRAILYELGLQGKLTTDQLAKKWDNLKRRYKVRQWCFASALVSRS